VLEFVSWDCAATFDAVAVDLLSTALASDPLKAPCWLLGGAVVLNYPCILYSIIVMYHMDLATQLLPGHWPLV
jgi:hypothetical protein